MARTLYSFDGTESVDGDLLGLDRPADLRQLETSSSKLIARGAGLSYCGAAAGHDVHAVSTLLWDRVLDFDAESGRILVEPGMRLGDLLEYAVPRGWYPPVLPGHPMITVGGCVGFNVHGKSQRHTGNFIDCVESLVLFHPSHGEIPCSREKEPELFALTVGGFGLTGFITRVELRLSRLAGKSVRLRRIPVRNLVEATEVMERDTEDAEAIYSWNDLNRRGESFGNGVVYVESFQEADLPRRGRFGPLAPEKRSFLPLSFFNRLTTTPFSRVYGLLESFKSRETQLDLMTAAFPISGKEIYYNLFGRAGFREYQMLVPRADWASTVTEVDSVLARSGIPATLGSLKLFDGEATLLNFCGSGVCLTLDVPATRRAPALFAELDQVVLDVGGILNLSKDSRITAELTRRMFPEYEKFKQSLHSFDPKRQFDSALRRRILV